ncbi:hypothetical protein [Acidocella sp. C78]|uniref:hypothetical protein n=1 Tax=Acidocella sp. C78 TaxID=1671486 RepID=UPI00191BA9ED|nr:hypothetical protein [Acidocella sp. C78]
MASDLSFRSFLRCLRRYVIDWLRFLGPNFKWEWTTIIPPAITLGVIFRLNGMEPAYRIGGGVLQIIGVASVFWGVRQTRSSFGQIGGWRSFLSRVKNYPRWRRDIIVMAGGAAFGGATASGRAVLGKGFPVGASVDHRLDLLLDWINQSIIDVDKVRSEIEIAKDGLKKKIENEKSERDKADHNLLKTMEGVSTGGLSLTVAATVWIMVGLVMSTFSVELAGHYISIRF